MLALGLVLRGALKLNAWFYRQFMAMDTYHITPPADRSYWRNLCPAFKMMTWQYLCQAKDALIRCQRQPAAHALPKRGLPSASARFVTSSEGAPDHRIRPYSFFTKFESRSKSEAIFMDEQA